MSALQPCWTLGLAVVGMLFGAPAALHDLMTADVVEWGVDHS